MTLKHDTKHIQSYLKSVLPQERFLVCPVPPRIDNIQPGYIAI
jgi:hypothetical protein